MFDDTANPKTNLNQLQKHLFKQTYFAHFV